MAKAKSKALEMGQILEAGAGGVGASFVTRILRTQLAKMQDQEKAAKMEKFAGLIPAAAGFAVAKFVPKFANVGYGMIAYGAADFVSGMIAGNIQNGPRYIVAPEYVTAEEVDEMAQGMNAPKMFLSPAIKQRIRARIAANRGGASMARPVFQPAVKRAAPAIIAEHYGADGWDADNNDEGWE
jgi:hypothetical protein